MSIFYRRLTPDLWMGDGYCPDTCLVEIDIARTHLTWATKDAVSIYKVSERTNERNFFLAVLEILWCTRLKFQFANLIQYIIGKREENEKRVMPRRCSVSISVRCRHYTPFTVYTMILAAS